MIVRVLGSNGWFSANGYNTVCLLIEAKDCYVVLDAGDGISKLDGYAVADKPVYLFLSHFHLDHTYGFHIFPKFGFKWDRTVTIFGQPGTKQALKTLANHPFTMPFSDLKMRVLTQDLTEGRHRPPETPFPVETGYLEHADPCFGYRLEIQGKIITYCTDTGYCDKVVELAQDADLLITECALAPGETENPGWPHLSPELAARAAEEARVKKLLLTHFSPRNYTNNEDRQQAAAAGQKIFSRTVAGYDGMELSI